jgi:hypothetical protein
MKGCLNARAKKSRDYQQIARNVLDAVDPDAEPKPEEAEETPDGQQTGQQTGPAILIRG